VPASKLLLRVPSRTAQQPHLTPPQPRGSRSPSAHRVPRACCSAAMRPRRHAPPPVIR